MKPDKVFITRPGQRGHELAAAIRSLGLGAELLNLINIVYFAMPKVAWSHYQKIIVTSAHAVTGWVTELKPPLQEYHHPNWYAIGSATQRTLLDKLGIDAITPEPSFENSEGLLALESLTQIQGEQILILKGKGGRTLISETLRKRGAQVDSLDLYERQIQNLPESAREWLNSSNNALIIVTSLEIANQLIGLLQNQERKHQRFEFLTSSERIAGELSQAGYTAAVCKNASNQSISAWVQAHCL